MAQTDPGVPPEPQGEMGGAPPIPTDIPFSLSGKQQDPITADSKVPEGWEDVTPKPEDQWEDVTPKPGGLVAFDGARHTPDDAVKALQAWREAGVGEAHFTPEGSAVDPSSPQYRKVFDSFRSAIEDSPSLYAYASRSPVYASLIAEDAEKWNALEKFLTGKIDVLPIPPGWSPFRNGVYDPGLADAVRNYGGLPVQDAPPVWAAAMARGSDKAWLSLKGAAAAMFSLVGRVEFGASQEESQAFIPEALRRSIEEQEQRVAGPIRGVGGMVSAGVVEVAELAPQMAALSASTLAGPEATFALMWAQTTGDLKLAGVDEGLALGGGFVSASMGMWFGNSLFKSLIPKTVAYNASLAGVMAMRSAIKQPLLRETFTKFGRLATHGWLLNMGMGITNELTMQLSQGQYSSSRLYESAVQATRSSAALLPYAMVSPIREHLEGQGRWVEAHADSLRIGGGLAALGDTKAQAQSPRDAQDVVRAMGTRPVYVDPKLVESAAKALGVDPAALTQQMTGRAGALETAQNAGTPLRVPPESLGLLKDQGAKVAENAKYEPDGSTLKEVQGQPPERLPGATAPTRPAMEASPPGSLAALLAEREVLKKEPDSPERAAKLADNYKRMASAALKLPVNPSGGPGTGTPERLPGEPLPGTGTGSKPELHRHAEDAVQRMTIGEIRSTKQVYQRAEDAAQRSMEAAQAQAVEKLAKAGEAAQKGIDKGIQSGEQGRASSQSNLQFARTTRFREWLKGLNTANAKPEQMPEPTSAETGLYNIPGIGVEVEKSLAEKFYALSEAQRKQAIELYKASEKSQTAAEDQSVKATGRTVEAGDAAGEAAGYERVRDLNKALGKSREKWEKEAGRIEKYIDKNTSDSIRRATYGAGLQYGVIYDGIMESLGKRVSDGTRPRFSVDDAVRALIDGGDEVDFDTDHISGLAAKPGDFDSLLPWEAGNVEKALRGVRKLVSQASKTYTAGQEVERSKAINDMDAALAKGSAGGKFVYTKKPTSSDSRKAENANADTLWRVMGPYGVDRLHQLDYALKFESDLQGKYLPKLEIPKELRKLGEEMVPLPNIGRGGKLAFLPDTVPRRDLWRAVLMAGNKDGMARLAGGYGVPEMEIERWLKESIKTRAEWDFIDSQWAGHEELYPLTAAVHAGRSGLLPKTLEPREWVVNIDGQEKVYKGGYEPFQWLDGPNGAPLPVSKYDFSYGLRQGMDTPNRYLKERIDGYRGIPDISWSGRKTHFEAMFHDISHSNFVRDSHRMITDPAFEDMVCDRLGQPWYDAMKDWLQVTALGKIAYEAGGARWYNALFREVKGWAASATFNLNFPVIGGQVPHLPIVSAGLGIRPDYVVKGTAHALTPEGWNEAAESPVVGFRNDRYASKLNRMWEQTLDYGSNPYREALSRASQEAQHAMDTFLSRSIYHAAKYQHMADHPGDIEGAKLAGDDAVRRGMPAMTVEHQSQLTRNRLFGFLTMVRNFQGTINNMRAMLDWETRVKISEGENPVWARTMQVGRVTGMVGGLALGLYMMGHGKDEDESWAQFAARTALTEYTYHMPLGHLAAQALAPTLVQGKINRRSFFSTPAGELMDHLVQDVGRLAQRDRPMDQKMWDALDALGRTIGAPLPPPLLRSAQGVYKLSRYHMLGRSDFHRTPRGPLDELSIAAYGERRTGTLLTDGQTLLGR